MTVALALFTSPGWKHGLPAVRERHQGVRLPVLCTLTAAAVYIQLLLGALMRHTDSGLSIPDFPLAFGRIVPAFTLPNIAIHFAHRAGAVMVSVMIVWTFVRIRRAYADQRLLVRPAAVMFVLLWVQVTLGAFTVWTAKSVYITTAHVATGALVLGTSVLLTLRAFAMVKDREPATVYPFRETAWQ
jgi:cytochrome c oxidase assembly protein subunit 15